MKRFVEVILLCLDFAILGFPQCTPVLYLLLPLSFESPALSLCFSGNLPSSQHLFSSPNSKWHGISFSET